MGQTHRASFASIGFIAGLAALVAGACSSNESDEALGRSAEALSSDGGMIAKEVRANADTYLRAWLPNQNEGWDAGNYVSAGLELWASAGEFYTAAVPMRLLAKRRPTGADAGMMACPIEGAAVESAMEPWSTREARD